MFAQTGSVSSVAGVAYNRPRGKGLSPTHLTHARPELKSAAILRAMQSQTARMQINTHSMIFN